MSTEETQTNNIDNFATDVIDKVLQGTQEAFDEKSEEERLEMENMFESNYYQITFDINLFTNDTINEIKHNDSTIKISQKNKKNKLDGTGKKSLDELINHIKDKKPDANNKIFKDFQDKYENIVGGSKLSIKFTISFQFEIKNSIVGIKADGNNKFYITSDKIISISDDTIFPDQGKNLKRKNNQFIINYDENIDDAIKSNIDEAFDTGSTEQIKNSDLKEIFNSGNFINTDSFSKENATKELEKLF